MDKPQGKVFGRLAVVLSSMFLTPITGAYMMAQNHKVLREPEKVKTTYLYSVLLTIFVGFVSFLLERFKIQNGIINFLIILLIYGLSDFFFKKSQAQKIENFIASGGKRKDGTTVFLVCLSACALMIFAMILITLYIGVKRIF